MTIDLQIGYDDLSEECKKKITKLKKLMGEDGVNINYPDIRKYFHDRGDYPGIAVPEPIEVPKPGEWTPHTGMPQPIMCLTGQKEKA